jgi:hypothetical protein
MVTRWQFWLLTVLAAIAAALIAANMYRFSENRRLQLEVSQRAQFIQQTVALEALNREIVSALAQRAVRGPDEQIRAMLSNLGMSVTETPAASAPASAATVQPRKK